jgi:hypothetical protein
MKILPSLSDLNLLFPRVSFSGPNRWKSRDVKVPHNAFPPMFFCNSGGVRKCVVVEETDAFDWWTSSFWKKGWIYSGFKKLRITRWVDSSFFYQKVDALRVRNHLAITLRTEGVVFIYFHPGSLRTFHHRIMLLVSTECHQVPHFR